MRLIFDDRAEWIMQAILPHESGLRRWLGRRHLPNLEVDDVVQEAYAVLAKLESISHIQNPKAYLYQTANSVILMHLRRQRVVSIETASDIEGLAGADPRPSPEDEAGDRDELRHVAETLANLPARCRDVFVLRKVHGFSQREVAQQLQISEKTVEKHVAKGLHILLAKFGRGGRGSRRASLENRKREAGVHDDADFKQGD